MSGEAMHVLITYDVSTDTKAGRGRLQKMAKLCKGFGQRVQKSVFECDLRDVDFEQFRKRLLNLIEEEKDSLRIYHLHGKPGDFVEEYGLNRRINFEEPLVV